MRASVSATSDPGQGSGWGGQAADRLTRGSDSTREGRRHPWPTVITVRDPAVGGAVGCCLRWLRLDARRGGHTALTVMAALPISTQSNAQPWLECVQCLRSVGSVGAMRQAP